MSTETGNPQTPAPAPTLSPMEQLAKDINDLQARYEDLQNKVKLNHLRGQVSQTAGQVKGVADTLAAARGRGYTLNKALDGSVRSLSSEWAQTQSAVGKQLDEQAPALASSLQPLENRMLMMVAASTNPTVAQPMVAVVKTTLQAVEGRLKALEESIAALLKAPADKVKALADQLDDVTDMLKLFGEATFKLQPGESPVAVERASWFRHGDKKADDDPDGFIFLTTRRLLFEQNEKVATKKFLFITTASEEIHKLLLDVPLAQVGTITPRDMGFLGLGEHLDVAFDGASVAAAHFQLGADNTKWQKWIEDAKAGGGE